MTWLPRFFERLRFFDFLMIELVISLLRGSVKGFGDLLESLRVTALIKVWATVSVSELCARYLPVPDGVALPLLLLLLRSLPYEDFDRL